MLQYGYLHSCSSPPPFNTSSYIENLISITPVMALLVCTLSTHLQTMYPISPITSPWPDQAGEYNMRRSLPAHPTSQVCIQQHPHHSTFLAASQDITRRSPEESMAMDNEVGTKKSTTGKGNGE